VFENKELRRIIGPKKEEVIETDTKLFWPWNVATTQKNYCFSSYLSPKFRKLDLFPSSGVREMFLPRWAC
jgi:hypothetical protein